jgi:hypothetical protein
MAISTRTLASLLEDDEAGGSISLTRSIQVLKQLEDGLHARLGRGVIPSNLQITHVSGSTVQLPIGYAVFTDGMLHTLTATQNHSNATPSVTVWLWAKVTVTRADGAEPTDQDTYVLTLQSTTGSTAVVPDATAWIGPIAKWATDGSAAVVGGTAGIDQSPAGGIARPLAGPFTPVRDWIQTGETVIIPGKHQVRLMERLISEGRLIVEGRLRVEG